MDEPSVGGLLLVVVVAFAAPFLLGLFPRLRLPSIVLEIVIGIVIGPAVLGWVELDAAIEVLALLGLAFLLFLAGLEIEFEHLKGRARQGHGQRRFGSSTRSIRYSSPQSPVR
jgi:Kef-type K+ transport system membrane component KefB